MTRVRVRSETRTGQRAAVAAKRLELAAKHDSAKLSEPQARASLKALRKGIFEQKMYGSGAMSVKNH